MPHEPMPPEPIDGRRTATEPTGDPRCAPPAATHRHHAPDATHLLFLRAASRMPHEPKPPEPIDGRRTAMEPTDDLAHAPPTTPPAATHRARAAHHTARRHAPSPRPRRDPHVHPRQDETSPVSEHTAALRVLRTSRRLTLGHQTAEPIHWCTRLHPSPHPAPALCSPRVPALGQGARHASPACSLSASAERRGLRPSKTRVLGAIHVHANDSELSAIRLLCSKYLTDNSRRIDRRTSRLCAARSCPRHWSACAFPWPYRAS
jgi:hypothetical protein